MFGRQPSIYGKSGRLADVIALIQSLALNEQFIYRENIGADLQVKPQSANSWEEVAAEHPEFFRVRPGEKFGVALIARHLLYINNENDYGKTKLSPEFIMDLMKVAIDMHDRQATRADRWASLIPVYAALTTAIFSLIAVLLSYVLTGKTN